MSQQLLAFANSFASTPMAKYWSKYNAMRPTDVSRSTHKLFKFDCPDCHHTYESSPNYINRLKNPCSYCTDKKLCGDPCCKMCLDKSFAIVEKALQWSDRNECSPLDVFR